MRTAILISLIIPPIALAQTPTHTWQVETAQRPASYALELIRGESITIAPQYLSNGVAMTLPGSATAALRYRSADMAAETYYSLSGTVTGSTARFSWASTNCAPATNYTYAIAITGIGVNLRSYGTLKLIGVVSGTQTSAPTLYAPYPWETAIPALSNSFLGNGSATINGAALTNGSSITVLAALPAGAITATNQGLPGQSFFFSAGTPSGTYTGYFATAAGSGDMLASVYDPNGVQRGVVFTNDARYLAALTNAAAFDPAGSAAALTNAITNALQSATTATNLITTHTNNLSNPHQVTTVQIGAVATNDTRYLAALTNAAAFATAAQGAKADTALQPSDTNGWVVSSHSGLVATNDARYLAAPACYQVTLTNTSALSYTNNWSATSAVSRVTATSTGTVTFVMNWPSSQVAYWGFCYDATGMPSTVFPAGAIYYTNGVYSSTAPTLGKSNYVSVLHSCASYQIMAFTNTLGTWGTP